MKKTEILALKNSKIISNPLNLCRHQALRNLEKPQKRDNIARIWRFLTNAALMACVEVASTKTFNKKKPI